MIVVFLVRRAGLEGAKGKKRGAKNKQAAIGFRSGAPGPAVMQAIMTENE